MKTSHHSVCTIAQSWPTTVSLRPSSKHLLLSDLTHPSHAIVSKVLRQWHLDLELLIVKRTRSYEDLARLQSRANGNRTTADRTEKAFQRSAGICVWICISLYTLGPGGVCNGLTRISKAWVPEDLEGTVPPAQIPNCA